MIAIKPATCLTAVVLGLIGVVGCKYSEPKSETPPVEAGIGEINMTTGVWTDAWGYKTRLVKDEEGRAFKVGLGNDLAREQAWSMGFQDIKTNDGWVTIGLEEDPETVLGN